MKLAVFLLAILCQCQPAFADGLAERIDAVVQKYVAKDQFSGSIAIKDSSGMIFERSYGMAVREHNVPNKSETVYGIGSLSKQFTAAAVMYLQQNGRLNVNNKISDYLEVPDSWRDIQVRQFLTHTSGLPMNAQLAPVEWAKIRSVSQYFDLLKSQFAVIPKERQGVYEYSNAGYTVMAQLIAKVTGEDHPVFMEKFFKQVHLDHTAPDHESIITPNHAQAYTIHDEEWSKACCLDLTNFAGAGEMRSRVDDLLKWSDILAGTTLFTEDTKAQLFETKVKVRKPEQFYGYGWITEPFMGRKMIWHNGSLRGFMSTMAMYDHKTTFVLIGNQNNIPTEEIRDEIMTLVFSQ